MSKIKPISNLNINGQIVDASIETPEKVFRGAWMYDGKVVLLDAERKQAILTAAAKEECGRRIFASASANTQMNMAAAAAVGLMSAEDLAAFKASIVWVATMRRKVADLVQNDDGFEKYLDRVVKNDASWPELPAAVKALVEKY